MTCQECEQILNIPQDQLPTREQISGVIQHIRHCENCRATGVDNIGIGPLASHFLTKQEARDLAAYLLEWADDGESSIVTRDGHMD